MSGEVKVTGRRNRIIGKTVYHSMYSAGEREYTCTIRNIGMSFYKNSFASNDIIIVKWGTESNDLFIILNINYKIIYKL